MEGFNINGKILIGIDHGYGNMKTRHTVFKSGVKCYSTEPAIASNVLVYDGKYYVIGSYREFLAAKAAGIEELPCRVVHMDASEQREIMNIYR